MFVNKVPLNNTDILISTATVYGYVFFLIISFSLKKGDTILTIKLVQRSYFPILNGIAGQVVVNSVYHTYLTIGKYCVSQTICSCFSYHAAFTIEYIKTLNMTILTQMLNKEVIKFINNI